MKNKLRLGIIIFCALQLMGLFFWSKDRTSDTLQVEYDGGRLYFYYRSTDRLYDDDKSIQINSYQDEDSGEFYLFFPGSFRGQNSRLILYGAEELVVNQEFYRTDDRVHFLDEGRYSIAVDGKFYVLNVMYGGKLPSVFIDLDTGNLDFIHENKENCDVGSLNMYDEKGKMRYRNSLLSMHGRGNYSWFYHLKKSYAISLAAKGALLDSVISDKWNLIGSSYDPYLIKNKIVYDMANDVNLEYSPQTEYIDLFVCGDYMGTYLLTNKVRLGEDNVDIDSLKKRTEGMNEQPLELYEPYEKHDGLDIKEKGYLIPQDPADITGGYLIEQEIYDRYVEEPSGFMAESGGSFVIQSPEYASAKQVDYMRTFIGEIERSLGAPDGVNPDTGKHFSEYIDMDSFVKDYLLQEISKNYDMNVTSQNFYKPKGENSLLYAGPVWDFDNSMGTSSNWMGGDETTGTKMDDPGDLLSQYYFYTKENFSFASFYLHDDFKQSAIQTYYDEFKPRLENLLAAGLDAYAERLGNSVNMNRVRWSLEKDWDTETEDIRDFLSKRMEFLDEVWGEGKSKQENQHDLR